MAIRCLTENIFKNSKQVAKHSRFTSHQCYYPLHSIKRYSHIGHGFVYGLNPLPHVIQILKTAIYHAGPSHIIEIGDGKPLSQSYEKQQYSMLLFAFQSQRLYTRPMISSRTRKRRRSCEQLGMVSSTCLRASRDASMELHSRHP